MPSSATSQPRPVLPTLAPKMMPREAWKLSNPALTKPTVATVVAVDDCTRAVPIAPAAAPLQGERVKRSSAWRRRLPPRLRNASVIRPMPSRNRPRPPAALSSPPAEPVIGTSPLAAAQNGA